MLNLIIRGRIIDVEVQKGKPGSKPVSTVTVEIRAFRQGLPVQAMYLVTLDAYWTERMGKLDDKTKYLSFRCSDIVAAHETNSKGDVVDYVWLKGEEFYL